MSRLYEILPAFAELERLADNPETQDEQVLAWLEECQGALQDKCKNIVMFIENLDATTDAIKAAEGRMADRRKALESRVKSIKAYVLRTMQAANIRNIECPEFKISRQNNPQSVVIDDEKSVSIEYWRQPETPPPALDKRMILDHIKNGVCVDGVHLEQSERLVIK
jgi:hypothetical protein